MASFLTTKNISGAIETIIKTATRRIVLVSPYLDINEHFQSRLKHADSLGIHTVIIYREEDKLKETMRVFLSSMTRLKLLHNKDLHAKCYHNDELFVITSMNLYSYSEQNNWEMGIMLSAPQDAAVISEIRTEVDFLEGRSNLVMRIGNRGYAPPAQGHHTNQQSHQYTPPPKDNSPSILSRVADMFLGQKTVSGQRQGFCIRCSTQIAYDPQRPLCANCYRSWAAFKNMDYPEAVCHSCGKPNRTTFGKPECRNCYTLQYH